MGHARGAVIGSGLANVLEAAGFDAEHISIDDVKQLDSLMAWYVASAVKA